MNLTALQTALKRFGFDDNDPLTTWINAAMHDLEMEDEWSFLEASSSIVLAANSNSLTLPADFAKAIKVVDQTTAPYAELDYWDIRKYKRLIDGTSTVGLIPAVFTIVGAQLLIWPTYSSSRTIDLTYTKAVTDLAAGGDVPGLPTALHYAIVLRAASIALAAENEEQRAENAETQYYNRLDQYRRRYAEKQTGDPSAVEDVMDYTGDYVGG